MKIVSIFGTEEGKLLAMQYADNEPDALSILDDQWNDPEYLREFFIQYEKDYRNYYGSGKIKDLVISTKAEANELFDNLYDLAAADDLGSFFKPLHAKEADESFNLQQLKAYGYERQSFLRIYAVRFNETYVITGGAIKLTNTMQERPHTKAELIKLNKVCDYLGANPDQVEFVYLTK
ncbi:MAG: hypothetical protein Roseis2KO_41430 [Roseivirga sp.]